MIEMISTLITLLTLWLPPTPPAPVKVNPPPVAVVDQMEEYQWKK